MKVVKLDPDKKDEYPRCQKKLSVLTREYWKGAARPQHPVGSDYCECYSTYKIGKKYMCRKHASLYVLDKLTVDLSG